MGTLAAVAGVYFIGYYFSLKIWPYTRCRKCEGRGRNTGSTWRRWGDCRACGGSGQKWRLGVRVFTPGRTRT